MTHFHRYSQDAHNTKLRKSSTSASRKRNRKTAERSDPNDVVAAASAAVAVSGVGWQEAMAADFEAEEVTAVASVEDVVDFNSDDDSEAWTLTGAEEEGGGGEEKWGHRKQVVHRSRITPVLSTHARRLTRP